MQRDLGQPFGQVARLVEVIERRQGGDVVDLGIAECEHAALVDDGRAMRGTPHGFGYRQHQRPEPHRQPHPVGFERQPLAVQPVMRARAVHRQLVDVGQVGAIDGVGPTKRLVMPQRHERHSRKQRPGHVPALIALHFQFVPRGSAAPRLVRVGNQPRHPVARALRRNRKGVRSRHARRLAHGQRTGLGGRWRQRVQIPAAMLVIGRSRAIEPGAEIDRHRIARDQRRQRLVQPEEERLAHGKAHGDIVAVDREQPRQLDLARMALREQVEPARIAIEQRAGIGGQRGIVPVDRAARVEQMIDEVDLGPVRPGNRAIAPTRHRHHILQRREIVLGMRPGNPEADVRIGRAVDMRHPPFIADDFGRIDPAGRRRSGLAGKERLPHHQPDEHQQGQCKQRPSDPGRPVPRHPVSP